MKWKKNDIMLITVWRKVFIRAIIKHPVHNRLMNTNFDVPVCIVAKTSAKSNCGFGWSRGAKTSSCICRFDVRDSLNKRKSFSPMAIPLPGTNDSLSIQADTARLFVWFYYRSGPHIQTKVACFPVTLF